MNGNAHLMKEYENKPDSSSLIRETFIL